MRELGRDFKLSFVQSGAATSRRWDEIEVRTVDLSLLDLGGILGRMTDVTLILSRIEHGDADAAEQLLPLVYDELRKLAAARLANEKPGQTLQATALVHDAYIRLVDVEQVERWDSRGHFFAAAAEAMRRILVESARRKARTRHGGNVRRVELDRSTKSRLRGLLVFAFTR